ncbi:GNAT family N-acetyltransferase [Kushneria aurantia]|uniref:GNAT family N-acetyltransferase n=1 Tax=Kushneria aurantia TaxID=504092 RepID=A0ABV6G0H9_9GAMM|nr:GNAT family N-acetyltransferase [Kushneria aurantia]
MTANHDKPLIRAAAQEDMAAVQAIYAHHVERGLGSFEETPPDVAEMTARWRRVTGSGLPWLVATFDDAVVGYAYAGYYHSRSGWRFCLEDSVYVRQDAGGRGVGSALLAALLERCAAGPWQQMIALVGDSDNAGSIALHERLGFRRCGILQAVGFKFGRWVDVVVMQRALGRGEGPVRQPVPPEPAD